MYCWVTRNHEHTYSIISKTLESKLIRIPIYITHTHKYEYNYPYMWKKEICSCSSEIREKNPLLKLYYMLIKYYCFGKICNIQHNWQAPSGQSLEKAQLEAYYITLKKIYPKKQKKKKF